MAEPSGIWRSRPIFISSTFRDMHAERDYLRDFIFPKLDEKLRNRRCYIEPIDLRWGVETVSLDDQEAKELLVLKVCLSEIERSRPFLVVLLGDRYGWIPQEVQMRFAANEAGFDTDVCGKSVTALEIEYGALTVSEQLHRTFFYFREPLPYDVMDHQAAGQFSDEYSDHPDSIDSQAKLAALKSRIEKQMPDRVRHYKAGWDSTRKVVTSLEDFGKLVEEDLWSTLDEETSAFAVASALDWKQQERWELEQFVERAGQDFQGRDDFVDLLTRTRVLQCISGEAGIGKSALFARVYQQLLTTNQIILAHSAGISARSIKVDDLLMRWITEITVALDLPPVSTEEMSSTELQIRFDALIREASLRSRVVMLIDGLERFEQTPRARMMSWMPNPLPGNVRFIVTTQLSQLFEQRDWGRDIHTTILPPLNEKEIENITKRICQRHHRVLHQDILAILKTTQTEDGNLAAGNPLWLTMAVEELNLLDADDFTHAYSNFTGDPDERLHQLLLNVARRLPANLPSLYTKILERAEEHFGFNWVRTFALLLAYSREGWREKDLKELLPPLAQSMWNDLVFAMLRRSWRIHLVQRRTQQWHFAHAQMIAAIEKRYVISKDDINKLHYSIADHLLSLPEDDPMRLSETMVHLMLSSDITRAAHFFADASLTGNALVAAVNVLAGLVIDGENDPVSLTKSALSNLLNEANLNTQDIDHILEKISLQDLKNFYTEHYINPMHILMLKLLLTACDEVLTLEESTKCKMFLVERIIVKHELLMPSKFANMVLSLLWVNELNPVEKLYLYERYVKLICVRLGYYATVDSLLYMSRSICDAAMGMFEIAQDDVLFLRILSKAFGQTGDVLVARGNISDALKYYQTAEKVLEKCIKVDVLDYDTLLAASDALERKARASALLGKCNTALEDFQIAAQIIGALRTQSPQDLTLIKRDLNLCVLGCTILRKGGQLSLGRQICQAGLDLINGDTRDLAITDEQVRLLHQIGDICLATGQVEKATVHYKQALSTQQKITNSAPDRLVNHRLLAMCHEKMADIKNARGEYAAITDYINVLKLYDEAYVPGYSSLELSHEMMHIRMKIGRNYMSTLDFPEAYDFFADAVTDALTLTAFDSGNEDYKLDQAWVQIQRMSVAKLLDLNSDNVLDTVRKIREELHILLKSPPEDCEHLSVLAQFCMSSSDLFTQSGEIDEGLGDCQLGASFYQLLQERDPDNIRWPRELVEVYVRLANLHSLHSNTTGTAEALVRLRETLDHVAIGSGLAEDAVRITRAKLDSLPGGSRNTALLDFPEICCFMELLVNVDIIPKLIQVGQLDQALKMCNSNVELCKRTGFTYDLITLLTMSATCEWQIGQVHKAKIILDEAVKLIERYPEHHMLASIKQMHMMIAFASKLAT